jgi:sortase family protein
VLLGVFAAGVGLGQLSDLPGRLGGWPAGWDGRGRGRGGVLERSTPTRISIPSLGVQAPVEQVGQASDGSIATPTADPVRSAGWYRLSPTPGERGSAVIVGHVDTASRPAVFQKLPDLGTGKLIEIRRRDRRVATFTVDSVEQFPKTAFPAARVFHSAGRPRLVLVTCGGRWVGGDIGYADNVVVFASLV